jgi:UDP-2-acetamido-2-deoxy-ribo-hexuluronate aminotransferase
MSVPFIELKRTEPGFEEKVSEVFTRIVSKAQFIGGEEVTKLEDFLKRKLNVTHAITCANGTDALQLALRGVGVTEGDFVLVPNVTFWATFEAIVNVGARPITVDSDPIDGGVNVEAFRLALKEVKPRAAIIAHLYGWGSRWLSDLRKICVESKVVLIEDGAQSFGTLFEGKSIYQGAYVSTTSFYPAKVFGGAGDGGAVFTNDDGLAANIRCLGNHGRNTHYGHGVVGWNSRLDSLQAAFLRIASDYIDARIESRKQSAKTYRDRLTLPTVRVVEPPASFEENGYCNVCIVPDIDLKSRIEASLKLAGIGFANIYPGTMSTQFGAKNHLAGHFGGDAGEKWCSSVLNLPLFPYMKPSELELVIDVVGSVK